ncbi:hypothetical protein Vlu01_48660 [Micromonospora lutea]|uniref:N-acetyltransferase domain-containing protein n=2 Tax=Micromonospora lutea TaxID=419825 RepID=A0ABQ4J2B4_9ACTN|nr:hypothetical protein Vlu01_48660 [Micromonospora lutea]
MHVELLPIGLFPSLGVRFVRRWQRAFVDSRHGVGLVVIDTAAPQDDEVVGFVLGTSDHAAHTTELAQDRRATAALAIGGLLALLVRPRVAVRALRTRIRPWTRRALRLRRTAGAAARTGPLLSPQVAVMTALAVRPDWRKSGIGVLLVTRFVELVREAGATSAEAQTSIGPQGAVGFYERLGWTAGTQRHTPGGDCVRTYHLALGARPAP